MAKFKIPTELPESDGAKADLLYKAREARLEVQKEVEAIAKLESQLKDYFINNLPKDTTGAAGRVARVQTLNKRIPQVVDWDKFYAFVSKKKFFHLLQRRLNDKAVTEIWENNKQVPGVDVFTTVTVSCTKV